MESEPHVTSRHRASIANQTLNRSSGASLRQNAGGGGARGGGRNPASLRAWPDFPPGLKTRKNKIHLRRSAISASEGGRIQRSPGGFRRPL
jgi:hypothetical protein